MADKTEEFVVIEDTKIPSAQVGAQSTKINKMMLQDEAKVARTTRSVQDNEVTDDTPSSTQNTNPTPGTSRQTAPTKTVKVRSEPTALPVEKMKPIVQNPRSDGHQFDTASSTGIFLLTKLFYEPPAVIIPPSSSYSVGYRQMDLILPRDVAKSPRPADFADSLILYHVKGNVGDDGATTRFDIESTHMPAEIVAVQSTMVRRAFVPVLTAYGQWINDVIRTQKSDSAAIRSMLPSSPFNDQVSAPILMWNSFATASEVYHDEAPILRGLCLMQMLMPLEWYHAKTQIVTNLQFHTDHVKFKEKKWTKAESSNTTIPLTDGTSTISIMSVSTYCERKYRYGSYPRTDVVTIPVLAAWIPQRWILAYILMFTSTKWWNHAMTITMHDHDSRMTTVPDDDGDSKFFMSAMPKGATVVIDGSYVNINLVIVDLPNQRAPVGMFIGGIIECATVDNNNNKFSDFAYKYLGRLPNGTYTITLDHVRSALEHIQVNLSNPASFKRVCAFASVLLGTYTMGYSCSTDPKKTGTWVKGPTNYDIQRNANVNKIDGQETEDWSRNDAGFRREKQTLWKNWRVNCFGMLCHTKVTVKTNTGASPSLRSISNYVTMYNVTEMADDIRILMVMGAFENYKSLPSAQLSVSNYDLMNNIYGHSVLLAAATNFSLAEVGMTLMDANKLSTIFRRSGYGVAQWYNILKMMTDQFVCVDENIENSLFFESDFIKDIGWITIHDDDTKVYDKWYSLFLPFWYVRSVAEKFGITMTYVETKSDFIPALIPNQDEVDDYGFVEVYNCSAGLSDWTDYNLMISTIAYDVRGRGHMSMKRFGIMLPTPDLRDFSYSTIGWWTYGGDGEWLTRELNRCRGMSNNSDRLTVVKTGVIDTLMVARPDIRWKWYKTNPRMFIEIGAHQKRDDIDSRMRVDLTIPDPFFDWLKQGVLNVAPYLATGDVWGAAAAGTIYVLETGFDKLKDFFLGIGDVEEVVDEYNLNQEIE